MYHLEANDWMHYARITQQCEGSRFADLADRQLLAFALPCRYRSFDGTYASLPDLPQSYIHERMRTYMPPQHFHSSSRS